MNFATLYHHITASLNDSFIMQLLKEFFMTSEEEDRISAIRLFTGKNPKKQVSAKELKDWCLEATGISEWLFEESNEATGDVIETISLIWNTGWAFFKERPENIRSLSLLFLKAGMRRAKAR